MKRVNISLPDKLVEIIDEEAKTNYCTRSDYIREAVMLRLNDQRIAAKPEPESRAALLEKQNQVDLWRSIC